MAALTKVHVECGVIIQVGKATDLFFGIWSETLDVGQTTTKTAVNTLAGYQLVSGNVVFRVRAPTASEIYGAEGIAPDASLASSTSEENNRGHLAPGELRDFPTKVGAKFATAAVV